MRTKVDNFINKYNMLEDTDVVILGVSGGPDSICLLFLMSEILKGTSISMEVVHVNHLIRHSAKRDADFVEEICKSLNVPFYLIEKDIAMLSKELGLSIEEAGRKVRYEAFNQALGNRRGRIAIAHNANDRAETMIFNLFRGTGIRGLQGISPVNGNIIRPLLSVTREEIEKYISDNKYPFVTDETNLTDEYTRNKIRHNIIEYANNNIVTGVVNNMVRAASQIKEADDYLEKVTNEVLNTCTISKETGKELVLDLSLLSSEDKYIIKRVMYEAVSIVATTKKDITKEHIESIISIFASEGSKELNLPYEITIFKEYDKLIIMKQRVDEELITESLPKAKMTELTEFNIADIPTDTYTKWFDYDKITEVCEIRNRCDGDYLTINSKLGKQSLQDYMVNQKIPKKDRDKIAVLADGSHIIWVIGYRISEYYKVSKETKKVLQVTIEQ